MKEFMISEKYRLELKWSKVRYDFDQIAILNDAYFTGPVLSEVEELQQEDSIRLDFTHHYSVIVSMYYIADLAWNGATHVADKIMLNDVRLTNANMNIVPKLKNNDYIVIDTSKHVDDKHLYNLVYSSYVLHADGSIYNFGE